MILRPRLFLLFWILVSTSQVAATKKCTEVISTVGNPLLSSTSGDYFEEMRNRAETLKPHASEIELFALQSNPETPIVDVLASREEGNRTAALWALQGWASSGTEQAKRWEILIPILRHCALNDPAPSTATRAFSVLLDHLPREQILPTLQFALAHQDARLRSDALRYISVHPEPQFLNLVRTRLTDNEPRIRTTAIRVLTDFHAWTARDVVFLNSLLELPETEALGLRGLLDIGLPPPVERLLNIVRRFTPSYTQAAHRRPTTPRWEFNGLPRSEDYLPYCATVGLMRAGYFRDLELANLRQLAENSNQFFSIGALRELARRHTAHDRSLFQRLSESPNQLIRRVAQAALTYYYRSAVFHPLYSQIGDKPSFFDPNKTVTAEEFWKDGSQTFLLSGPLAGRVIARVIRRSSADAWRRALNATQQWRDAGFNYVPVEPIYTRDQVITQFGLNAASREALRTMEAGITDPNVEVVYTGVLMGPNLSSGHVLLTSDGEATGAPTSLERQRTNIRRVLNRVLNIRHGHPHYENFMVTNNRNVPRVHVIDFDAANIENGPVTNDSTR